MILIGSAEKFFTQKIVIYKYNWFCTVFLGFQTDTDFSDLPCNIYTVTQGSTHRVVRVGAIFLATVPMVLVRGSLLPLFPHAFQGDYVTVKEKVISVKC